MDTSVRSIVLSMIAIGLSGQAQAGFAPAPAKPVTLCLASKDFTESVKNMLRADMGFGADSKVYIKEGQSAEGVPTVSLSVSGPVTGFADIDKSAVDIRQSDIMGQLSTYLSQTENHGVSSLHPDFPEQTYCLKLLMM